MFADSGFFPCCFHHSCFQTCFQPNPESALNEEAGKLLLEDYDEYAKQARLMTQIHANKKLVSTAQTAPQDENAGKDEEAKVRKGKKKS
jgi:ubiquitin-conjugating enzyme E2 S